MNNNDRSFLNWASFEVKAKKDIHKQFEYLCRMLFSEELNIPIGKLVTLKNLAGIETEPIVYNDELTGFQSKYFEKIEFDVEKFKKSIDLAKNNYPKLDTIYIYTNRTPTPRHFKELGSYAEEKNIKLEFRCNIQIFQMIETSEKEIIYSIFFKLNSEAELLIKRELERKASLLEDIKTLITYKQSTINIDRHKELDELKKAIEKHDVVIISGRGGCGKSCLMKLHLEEQQYDAVIIKKGYKMNGASVRGILDGTDEHFFFDTYNHLNDKLFVIDSAEQMNCNDEQAYLLRGLQKRGWKILITCREGNNAVMFNFVHNKLGFNTYIVNVPLLEEKELCDYANQFRFNLPTDHHLRDYITIPMYLSLYLTNTTEDINQISFSDFKTMLWNEKIFGNYSIPKRKMKDILETLAKAIYLEENISSVDTSKFDDEAMKKLEDNQILKYDDDSKEYLFVHDLYGEWTIVELLEKEKKSIRENYVKYGISITGRRCFRHWISDKMDDYSKNQNQVEKDELKDFINEICSILTQKETNELKNDIIIAILQSNNINHFLQENKEMLKNNWSVLKDFLLWLSNSCVYISEDDFVPIGKGWEAVISFIFDLEKKYWLILFHELLSALFLWSEANEKSNATRMSGEIALWILKEIQSSYIYIKVIPLVFLCSYEITDKIKELITDILAKEKIEWFSKEERILDYVITGNCLGIFRLSKCLPELVMNIWNYCWWGSHIKRDYKSRSIYDSYGLFDNFFVNISKGALGTSMVYSLVADEKFGKEYLPTFFNKAVENFYNTPEVRFHIEEIIFELDGEKKKQYSSDTFWYAFRSCNTIYIPSIIISLLLSLQWFIDRMIDCEKIDIHYLKNLIKKSNNVMVTAVVVSVALNHLNKCRNLIDELAQSKDLISLENYRLSYEMIYSRSRKNPYIDRLIGSALPKALLDYSISLSNYTQETITLPSFSFENKKESVIWAEQVLLSEDAQKYVEKSIEDKNKNRSVEQLKDSIELREEAKKYVKKAKEEFEQYPEWNLTQKLYLSRADVIAPAYIKICEGKDEYTDWCCEIIIDILKENENINNFLYMYDERFSAIINVPLLLNLYPHKKKIIFEALLSVCFISDLTPLIDTCKTQKIKECLVDTIRNLWDRYQSEIFDLIRQYLKKCREKSEGLKPDEVMFALRMFPLDKTVCKIEYLRLSLIKRLFSFKNDLINKSKSDISIGYEKNPISEILIHNPFSIVGRYTFYYLRKSLSRNEISCYILRGLIVLLKETNNINHFFWIWKKFAASINGSIRLKCCHISLLEDILTFQDDSSVVSNNAGNQEFNNYSYEFFSFLVSKYAIGINIINGILLMMEHTQNDAFKLWLSLLHKALGKSDDDMLFVINLHRLEDIMQKSLNVVDTENYKQKIQDILDMMVNCGSARAYYMKENM